MRPGFKYSDSDSTPPETQGNRVEHETGGVTTTSIGRLLGFFEDRGLALSFRSGATGAGFMSGDA